MPNYAPQGFALPDYGTDHARVHLRCQIYDCGRIPNSQNIGQFLELVGASIYVMLGTHSSAPFADASQASK